MVAYNSSIWSYILGDYRAVEKDDCKSKKGVNDVPVCGRCGKEIRFIRRTGKKALMVNAQARYFIPDEKGRQEYILSNGTSRKGNSADDGLRGFILHQC